MRINDNLEENKSEGSKANSSEVEDLNQDHAFIQEDESSHNEEANTLIITQENEEHS